MHSARPAIPLACSLVVACATPLARAQATQQLDAVVVTGTRVEERRFDVPAAIDVVDGERLRDQQQRVNLSETLVRVPGLLIQNRQNYAQDLQLSSRGFGARATFGVRGVRLLQDGIPITMPDGQGQTALFDLDNAARVEVLRGPFAALYGNSSGGVVQLFTADPPATPTFEANAFGASFGTWRLGGKVGAQSGDLGVTGNAARFETQGYRDHSAAVRDTANTKVRWALGAATSLTFVGNVLDQPGTEDPLGLTQAQLDADRRQAGSNAALFDTHKDIFHRQAGLVLRHRLGEADRLEVTAYSGTRRVTQFLAIPVAAQGITSSGGIVDLDRSFDGTAAEWRHTGRLAERAFDLTFGLAQDRMAEARTGFVNNNGVQGAPRRDEMDRVTSTDQYAIANWRVADRWKISGGLRHSRVRFVSEDHFVVGPNPDDSGSTTYSRTSPVAGVLFEATRTLHIFASVGRGFETPTFAELGYRPDGRPGLNLNLRPAISRNAEAGLKLALPGGLETTATVFRADTTDETVPATSSGGRNTFFNAHKTRREGLELAAGYTPGSGWEAYAAYTYTRARFVDYTAFNGADLSGNRIPGVPRHTVFADVAWRHQPSGFKTALALRAASALVANDANTAGAPRWAVLNWRAGFQRRLAGWTLQGYVGVDNLLDREYVGSVIVNEANQRYFEPAPGRSVTVGATAAYAL